MDKTMVKRLAAQCGVVDNFEIGSDTAIQEQLDVDCLTKFAHACCAWQKEHCAAHLETVCCEGRPRLEQVVCSELAAAIRES